MALKVRPPHTFITQALRAPVYSPEHAEFRYRPTPHRRPASVADFTEILRMFREDFSVRPGHINWEIGVGYQGAIMEAMKEVDRDEVMAAYPAGIPELNVEYENRLTWGMQILKVAAAFTAFKIGITLDNGLSLGIPVEDYQAFVYLALNASRNIIADLSAKHGFSGWGQYWHHVKWGKLTDSLLVTSIGYFTLSSLMAYLRPIVGTEYAGYVVPILVTAADSALQIVTRFIRGFPVEVARYDFLRPPIGDAAAGIVFKLAGIDVGANRFAYLSLRKVYCELWSGNVEVNSKRSEKIPDRYLNLQSVLRLEDNFVPDPVAKAAIDLVFLAKAKSLSRDVIGKVFGGNCMGLLTRDEFVWFGKIKTWRIWRALIKQGYIDQYGIIQPKFGNGEGFELPGAGLTEDEVSLAADILKDAVFLNKEQLLERLQEIDEAMQDTERIRATAQFLFAGEWNEYAREIFRQFLDNRHHYLAEVKAEGQAA